MKKKQMKKVMLKNITCATLAFATVFTGLACSAPNAFADTAESTNVDLSNCKVVQIKSIDELKVGVDYTFCSTEEINSGHADLRGRYVSRIVSVSDVWIERVDLMDGQETGSSGGVNFDSYNEMINVGNICRIVYSENLSTYVLDDDDTFFNVDQEYTVEQDGETTFTDVKKVNVTWSTTVINSKYEQKKTWNPKDRKWNTVKTQKENAKGGANFTLTNFSSVPVKATIAFNPETAMADKIESMIFTKDGSADEAMMTAVALDTPVVRARDEYTEDEFIPVDVAAEITVKTGAFNGNNADAANERFGTYTITISDADPAPDREKENAPDEIKADEKLSTLKVSDLLSTTPDKLAIGEKEYYVYNTFATEYSVYSDWDDAMAFVDILNSNKIEGSNEWRLFSGDMYAISAETSIWYKSYGTILSDSDSTGLTGLWTGIEYNFEAVYAFSPMHGGIIPAFRAYSGSNMGFVLIRPVD